MSEKFSKFLRSYHSSDIMKMYGFSWKNTHALTTMLDARNGNVPLTIVCDEWSFIDYFRNTPVFGKCNVEIDDEFIQEVTEFLKTDMEKEFIIICPSEEYKSYGIISL